MEGVVALRAAEKLRKERDDVFKQGQQSAQQHVEALARQMAEQMLAQHLAAQQRAVDMELDGSLPADA